MPTLPRLPTPDSDKRCADESTNLHQGGANTAPLVISEVEAVGAGPILQNLELKTNGEEDRR
jgi:hypothetical protein